MIQKEYGNAPWIRAASFYLRTLVFIQEQKIDSTHEFDEYDTDSREYLAAYFNQDPIATARFRHDNHILFPDALCVKQEWRRKGLGTRLLIELEIRGIIAQCHTSIVYCQKSAVAFFESLDYQKTGHPFIKNGHIWFTLEKNLTIHQLEKIYQPEHILRKKPD